MAYCAWVRLFMANSKRMETVQVQEPTEFEFPEEDVDLTLIDLPSDVAAAQRSRPCSPTGSPSKKICGPRRSTALEIQAAIDSR